MFANNNPIVSANISHANGLLGMEQTASTPSMTKMTIARMHGLRRKGCSLILSARENVTPPPNTSNAPHIRLKYVNASLTPTGSRASLPAISGVNVAAMCTNPISIMPMDNAFVQVCLLNTGIRFIIKRLIASPILVELLELLVDHQFKEEACDLAN